MGLMGESLERVVKGGVSDCKTVNYELGAWNLENLRSGEELRTSGR